MSERIEVFSVAPADETAAPWFIEPSGRTAWISDGRLPKGAIAEWRPWQSRSTRRMTPVPELSILSSALLILPELVAGLPMAPGVDYVEVEVARNNFPHRVLGLLPAPRAFNREVSEYTSALDGRVIISVQRHVFNEEAIGTRTAFTTEDFGDLLFVTRPVVTHLEGHGARGLTFTKLWSSSS